LGGPGCLAHRQHAVEGIFGDTGFARDRCNSAAFDAFSSSRIATPFYRIDGIVVMLPCPHLKECPNEMEDCMTASPSGRPTSITITLRVNGAERKLTIPPWTTLLDALRERLNLTGTKKGCDHGQCGACTVLIEGRRVNSCLTLAVMKDGAKITTIEGLATREALHPLQQAFIDHDAFQCGYCTPGQICSAAGLIAEGKAKTAEEIRELMSGNVCRCGAYPNIVAAIQQAMGAMGGEP